MWVESVREENTILCTPFQLREAEGRGEEETRK